MSKLKEVVFRSHYNYDTKAASDEATVKDFGPSLTVQSMADDVDINVIMKRFGVTGKMPDNVVTPSYGDFEEIFDFQTAMAAVRHAQENFDALPAELRARFANNPQMLLEFVSNGDNRDEARKLGLLKPEPEAPASPPAAKPPAAAG